MWFEVVTSSFELSRHNSDIIITPLEIEKKAIKPTQGQLRIKYMTFYGLGKENKKEKEKPTGPSGQG